MSQIKATIVIPFYNESEIIEDCFTRVIAQKTTIPYNIIFVNNNSTDGGREKLECLMKKFPGNEAIILLDEPEQGVGSARRAGWELCVKNHILQDSDSDHIICSMDADSVIPEDWVERYWQQFKELPDVALLVGDNDYDISQLSLQPNLKKFLEIKSSIESVAANLTTFKGGASDMAFKTKYYWGCGGLDNYYYIYKEKLVQSPGDDWNLSLKLLRADHKLDYCSSGAKVSVRKFTNSIAEVLSGNLYDAGWEEHNHSAVTEIDISKEQMRKMLDDSIRGILTYQILANLFISDYEFKEFCIVAGIGVDQEAKLYKIIQKVKRYFPFTPLDDNFAYYAPARFLYFVVGEEILEILANKAPEYKDHYFIQKEIPIVRKMKSRYDGDRLDQALYQLSIKTSMLNYFGEY